MTPLPKHNEIEQIICATEVQELEPIKELSPFNRIIAKFTRIVFLGVLFLCPLLFGSVHEITYLPMLSLVFILAAAFLSSNLTLLRQIYHSNPVFKRAIFALAALLIYLFAQIFVYSILSRDHPVFGSSGLLGGPASSKEGVIFVMAFFCLFVITRCYLEAHSTFTRTMKTMIISAGIVVALIALGHWYYDSGKLFGIFEPNAVFISHRARWPFINPNHLGTFLLVPLFIAISSLVAQFSGSSNTKDSKSLTLRRLSDALSLDQRFQQKFLKLLLAIIAVVVCSVAIAATLSRGTWAGLVCGLFFILLAYRRAGDSRDTLIEQRSRRRSPKSKSSESAVKNFMVKLKSFFKPMLLLIIASLVVFFLSEHGRDLLLDRLEFGLLHSKDDIRWQMYSDSMALLKENPFFGIGFRNWAFEYNRVMSPLLAGANPVYLHSDPLQLFIELGLFGSLPVIFLVVFLLTKSFSVLRKSDSIIPIEKKAPVIGFVSGLLAMIVGSCFDFPFRITAIVFCSAIYLSMLTFYLDKLEVNERSR